MSFIREWCDGVGSDMELLNVFIDPYGIGLLVKSLLWLKILWFIVFSQNGNFHQDLAENLIFFYKVKS